MTLDIILSDVKKSILNYCTPLKFIVIGSNKNGILKKTDIDIIIIVKDNIDLFHLSQEIAPSIRDLNYKIQFLYQCFSYK